MTARLLALRDGRQLCWREYGAVSGGFPVVFSHGNLNSKCKFRERAHLAA